MGERGSALAEALVATAITGLVWAAAAGVLSALPAQAARWEDATAMRQRLRVIETRIGRIVADAAPVVVEADGAPVRVPSVWPRRLGLIRPGAEGEVSEQAVTVLSPLDGHRRLTLAVGLAAAGGEMAALPQPGCGTQPACGLGVGDLLLVVAADGACGLYRVDAAGVTLRVSPLMPPAASDFGPGSAVVPIRIESLSFDAVEQAVRRYDGYRSDNVMADGVRALSIVWTGAAIDDGPFIGTGALSYDADQIDLRRLRMTIELIEVPSLGVTRRSALGWSSRGWR